MKDLITLDYPEKLREYNYKDYKFSISNVTKLGVSDSGTHYLEDSSSNKYIIPTGWLYIKVEAEEWSL